jgi:hypothetical protein
MVGMDNPASPPRPRQVTLSAWLIMVGSVLVVVMVFDRMAGLHSLETRESVQKFLSEPPGDDLGMGVEGVLGVLRTLSMVAAGCATAAAILGYQVLRRSRSARVALTLLAVPLFLTGMVTGGFLSSVVAASAVMLWFQPSRDWFDGVTREPKRPAADRASSERVPDRAPDLPPAPGPGPAPSEPGRPQAWPGFGTPAAQQPAMPNVAGADPAVRPGAVVAACLLTWACSTLAILLMVTSVAVLATSPGLVFDELARQNPELVDQGVTEGLLRTATYVMAGVVALWSAVSIVLAALVWRGVGWARRGLVFSCSGAAVLLLLATVGQVVVLLPLAACVVTIALLIRPDVRAWFDRPTGSSA